MTNRKKLEKAGVIPTGYKFPKEHAKAIENLSDDEVNSLIKIKDKLGNDFLTQHAPRAPGILL